MSEDAAQTSVKLIIKGWEIEASVNMETVPIKVYQETKEERQTVCWLPSDVGKAYSVTMTAKRNGYDRIVATVMIDGQQCSSVWLLDKPYTASDTRVDATTVREWLFSQPRLDEEDGPLGTKTNDDLGAIVVEFRRARMGAQVMSGGFQKLQDGGSISEKTKKGILGAVTTFREKQATTAPPRFLNQSIRKPEDTAVPMWKFRFNYAPEAVLQAQGRIPIKHNISRGQAGWDAAAPIDLDDDSAPVERPSRDQKPRIGEANVDEADAREAALVAELARLREKKRKQSSASVNLSDDESDNKEAVKRRMSKKLDSKKATDGGKVDLTLDSD
ncbi:hypothetical protein QFC21_005924 [Naganishia friedmannii]|uniref:Uncharacterized protein n=1 Tax=Naganishia friedmannii TaxID=89922 RepID=A0ACC2V5Z1_9TREE|nr:hypothetical protein QFC21_005924 [Naganishia friedmannii]